MKILILKDKLVTNLTSTISDIKKFYKTLGIEDVKVTIETRDFSNLNFEDYYGGNYGIERKYLEDQTSEVFKKHHYDVDFVTFVVHQRHWEPVRVWGWNMSNQFNGYSVQQVRYDANNPANTFGVMWHEHHHAFPHLVYKYLGINLATIHGVGHWGNDITHGGSPKWNYIRYKENGESVRYVRTLINNSFLRRREIYMERRGMLETIVNLSEKAILLYRELINRLQKDTPIQGGNKCG
jgi:hypothetical protein